MVADEELIQRLVRVVKEAGDGLNVGDLASRLDVSRPTASKYLEICESRKLVESTWLATARYVTVRGGAVRRRAGDDR